MADGHHGILKVFFSSIFQPLIIWFLWNLINRYRFSFWEWSHDKETENFQIQDGGWMPYIVFQLYSAPHCPINAKFGVRKQNLMLTHEENSKFWKSNDRWLPFWKCFYLSISAANYPILVEKPVLILRMIHDEKSDFSKSKTADRCDTEYHFLAISQRHTVGLTWTLKRGSRIKLADSYMT